ncbi:cryptochrome/photolyase family protein [Steroidobacter sp.]|uniref:cryptochrome/photolyase family protein n=1 Tax=Steroidobacter sp. TaxID=1978227 RepID=UPI001A5890BE|nr:deoxyribodipyrimidine photo-lyase [Steroidobacter sp.]MBL8267322.1 deoxyribodipyrimidine photo-lyase [Steroidobacter sp.]
MKTHRTALVWFRRDLRLTDNPALLHALANAERVVPLFVFAPEEEQQWAPGAASLWWLHHSLAALNGSLRKLGSALVLQTGPSLTALRRALRETDATLVCWNKLYEPAALKRDAEVAAALDADGVSVEQTNGTLLFEPGSILNGSKLPYRVFTPFWRTLDKELVTLPAPLRAPRQLPAIPRNVSRVELDTLELLPKIAWDQGLADTWTPGEAGALKQLKDFGKHVAAYPTGRDRPDREETSRLAPHLHFGELGPRQVVATLRHAHPGAAESRGTESYLRQVGWREFAHHLLFHFPATTDAPLNPMFAKQKWRRSRADLRAWQRGATGIPLVDAGMRELWRTGWMHNRVRMIVASLLTKNLQIHWLEGAHWFWDTLVDADLANNTLGWQWVAGCGADAAPYYRIFNPVLQAKRFDPLRGYIRQWLPELARLPDRWIHQPWTAPDAVLKHAGVELGVTYPRPVVDLGESRNRALQVYSELR